MSVTSIEMPYRVPFSHRLRSAMANIVWAIAPFIALVGVWWSLTLAAVFPPIWLPSPPTVWEAFVRLSETGALLDNTIASLSRLFGGYAISVVMGVGLGVLMGMRTSLADFLEPLVAFLNGIAGIVWIPLAVLWLGVGTPAVTFVIWNSMFFLILLNTLVGVRAVPRVYESAMLTMGARRPRIIRDVLVPGALPNIVTGLRLGMGFGWRALIAAEMIAAPSGLGFLIYDASYYFRTADIFVGLIVIGCIWLTTNRLLLVPLEQWTYRRWGLAR